MDRTGSNTGRAALIAPMAEALFRLGEWHRRRQMRKSFAKTADVLLRDIGLTWDDVEQALAQPLSEEASEALGRESAARAGNW